MFIIIFGPIIHQAKFFLPPFEEAKPFLIIARVSLKIAIIKKVGDMICKVMSKHVCCSCKTKSII